MASKLPVDIQSLGDMEEAGGGNAGGKKGGTTRWPGFVHFFFVLSVVLCALVYAPRFFVFTAPSSTPGIDFFVPQALRPSSSPLSSIPAEKTTKLSTVVGPDGGGGGSGSGGERNASDVDPPIVVLDNQVRSPCSSQRNNSICCDRSDFNTDICFMSGDVRTDAASLSFLLFPPQAQAPDNASSAVGEQRVRPYPRKWERHLMKSVHQVKLRVARPEEEPEHRCDVRHDAPAFVMTAGGYTGNLFHAFNDGFLPAWLTVQHLRRRVVPAVLAYNPWWAGTFREIISGITDYHVIDLLHDKRTHCFPSAIVGVRFHGIISVDPARTRDNRTIIDFHNFLASVYETEEDRAAKRNQPAPAGPRRPRLGIYKRRGTRVIENMPAVAQLAASVGFDVDIIETATGMPLAAEYAAVSACDVLVGVHGADLTKLLFLRPGAALLQIAPLGVGPTARGCYRTASEQMGLHYEQYDVAGHESSLIRKYAADDVVITDPEKAIKQGNGWQLVARVYLGGQNVTLDLGRFRETLTRLHSRALLSTSPSSSSPTPAP